MSRSDKLALIAIAVSVVAIFVGAAAARRWGSRRRKIILVCEVFSLLPARIVPDVAVNGGGLLRISYDNVEVKDPRLLVLTMINVGSSDIASANFDGNRPLIIQLNCRLAGVLGLTSRDKASVAVIEDEAKVEMHPQLFAKGSAWRLRAIVEGGVQPDVINSLVDTKILFINNRNSDLTLLRTLTAIFPMMIRDRKRLPWADGG